MSSPARVAANHGSTRKSAGHPLCKTKPTPLSGRAPAHPVRKYFGRQRQNRFDGAYSTEPDPSKPHGRRDHLRHPANVRNKAKTRLGRRAKQSQPGEMSSVKCPVSSEDGPASSLHTSNFKPDTPGLCETKPTKPAGGVHSVPVRAYKETPYGVTTNRGGPCQTKPNRGGRTTAPNKAKSRPEIAAGALNRGSKMV